MVQMVILITMVVIAIALAFAQSWPAVVGVLVGCAIGDGLVGHVVKKVVREKGELTPPRKISIGALIGLVSPLALVGIALVIAGLQLWPFLLPGALILTMLATALTLLLVVRRMSLSAAD
jgi:hypothetical protein